MAGRLGASGFWCWAGAAAFRDHRARSELGLRLSYLTCPTPSSIMGLQNKRLFG
jgi:hypothetical protein